jgi:hypothetical protein
MRLEKSAVCASFVGKLHGCEPVWPRHGRLADVSPATAGDIDGPLDLAYRIHDLLVNAKRQTYAAQGDDATVTPLVPGSRQLEYQEGALLYRDIYFGMAYFVGQETVYEGPTPVWAMGYAGGVLSSSVASSDVGQVYEFLRAALRHVTPERPYRGPRQWCEGPYIYTDEGQGDVQCFWGVETITRADHTVYQLRYSGGLLR